MNFTEYSDKDENDTFIDLNDISTFLYSIGYLTKQKYNNLKRNENSLKNYELILEENTNITVTESSVKYGTLLNELNKIFNTNSSFEEHFIQYKSYTKSNMNFSTYLNYLIILIYIINKYDDIININSLMNLDKEKISIIEIDAINKFQNKTINKELNDLYENLKNKSIYNEKEINPNLILLIFILSLNNTFILTPAEKKIKNIVTNFNIYNKIYFSDIDIGLLLYLENSIFFKIYTSININIENTSNKYNKIFNKIEKIGKKEISTRNKRKSGVFTTEIFDKLKKPFTTRNNLDTNNNNLNKTEMGNDINMTEYNSNNNNIKNKINNLNDINHDNNSIMNDMSNIPNLYLFDNENIKFQNNAHITIFMFQNYLKLISFYDLAKYNICLLVNLTIINLHIFREELKAGINNDINKNEIKKNNINEVNDIKEYYSLNNYKNYDFKIFEKINTKSVKNIYLDQISFFTDYDILNLCLKKTFINEFLIKVACFNDEKTIEQILKTYFDLIKKSNIFFMQEPPVISNNLIDNLSINDLHLQYNILFYIFEFFTNLRNSKKPHPKIINFKFNTFKMHINSEIKNIQLFFDFSKLKEKTLFQYLVKNQKLLILYRKYENILYLLREIKNYESKIRLSQSNFRSHQVNFLYALIVKKLVDYLDEMKTNKISILEAKFNTFNPNMKVYIKNENMKKKTRIEEIRHMIQTFPLYSKIKVLYYYINQLEENFDLIMLSENFTKDFRLIRKCDENQIYFFITKETKKINLIEKEKQIEDKKFSSTGMKSGSGGMGETPPQNSENGYNQFLNIIFYIKNDQNSFMNIINFLNNLIEDGQCELQNNITIICDRFFLESYVIMEPSLKSTSKRLFAIVDNFFLIAKRNRNNDDDNDNDNENYNYDIYIADNYISVANYNHYNNKTNNYAELVYEFLTCLSSCIELIIYSLRTKDIYLEKFYYLMRTINDKYFYFEYKNSNIFIKQLKDFDSLLFFNPKNSIPLLCLLPKIPESEYTMSVDNFYDVYLRLFLNLNKVEEQKEKLSQIFLYKIHKNIFYENYDSIILISYSYQAFNIFNDFFLKNNFLTTTKEKFNNAYFFPFDEGKKNNNYENLILNQKKGNSVVENIYIYDYGFSDKFNFNKKNYFILGYNKSEYLLEKTKEVIENKNLDNEREEKKIIFKILKNKKCNKKDIKKIVNNIVSLWKKTEKFNIYHLNVSDYENVLKNYQKNLYQMQTQKVDKRLQNLTEDAINNYNNLKNKQKNCIIF